MSLHVYIVNIVPLPGLFACVNSLGGSGLPFLCGNVVSGVVLWLLLDSTSFVQPVSCLLFPPTQLSSFWNIYCYLLYLFICFLFPPLYWEGHASDGSCFCNLALPLDYETVLISLIAYIRSKWPNAIIPIFVVRGGV